MQDALTIDSFRPLQRSTFVVRAEGAGELPLALVEVQSLGAPHRADAREPFSLLFRGPVEPILPQATYRLEHEQLGAHDIFVVPVARTAEGTDYEAVFT